MKRKHIYILGATAATAVAALGLYVLLPSPPIPDAIKRELTSTLLIPRSPDVTIIQGSAKYESNLKLLTYTLTAYGTPMVVSEQPTPDTFVDIPQAYDKVVEGMLPYKSFNTDIGTVHLTHPKDLNGKQAAVLNAKGTLLFAKPERNLSDDEWRKFFGSLVVVK